MDAIVMALYHLQAFYHNKVQRRFAGLGNYSLCVAFEAAKCSADELNIVPAIPPEDIVSRVRERATGTDAERVLAIHSIHLQGEEFHFLYLFI